MLMVFAFSVTPKILLHNLVADHRDTPRSHNNSKEQQLSKTGFNCNCDNLVVESPFVNDYVEIDLSVTQNFSGQKIAYENNFYSLHYFYFELRGPPSFMLSNLF
ncbi:MAG TPA: hypothetical protein VKT28_15985 [Puia sp.]|nr:hypothetical protein [Puia sp.]